MGSMTSDTFEYIVETRLKTLTSTKVIIVSRLTDPKDLNLFCSVPG